MASVKQGDKVRVHYTGKIEGGEAFDSTYARGPLELQLGSETTVIGFEEGIIGMEVGEKKSITVAPDKGFGRWSRNNIMQIKLGDLPGEITPTMGQRLQIPMEGGRVAMVTVTKVGDTRIEVDGNHPLAGKTLIFDVELLGILSD